MVAPGQCYVPTVAVAASWRRVFSFGEGGGWGGWGGGGVAYLEQLQTVGVITRPSTAAHSYARAADFEALPKICIFQKVSCGLLYLTSPNSIN